MSTKELESVLKLSGRVIIIFESIEEWMVSLGLDKNVPNAYSIWRESRKYHDAGDTYKTKLYQNMNLILHNSSIPATVEVGKKVNFAYGGIGLIIHYRSIIGDFATIGSNVTLGGRTGSKVNYCLEDGTKMTVPRIGKYAYIATGSKILGGVDIGACAIVGANSVVLNHVPPCSVVVGSPARVVARIDSQNYKSYKNNFTAFRGLSDEEILEIINSYSE